ncbi:MAG: protease complex subunit PrcB family protein [Candidatus Woesearchaeota archaeon]
MENDSLEKTFATIDRGNYCEHLLRLNYVITDNQSWKDLWMEVKSATVPDSRLPRIDFDKEMVIGVFMGNRSTGGYSVEITNLIEKDDSLEVYVCENTPKVGGMRTMGFSQPYHVIKSEKSEKEVKFLF